MAKVGLAAIADPEQQGLNVFGHLLHGWGAVFKVFYAALTLGIVMLLIVAYGEERRIRKLSSEHEVEPAAQALSGGSSLMLRNTSDVASITECGGHLVIFGEKSR